MKHIAYFDKEPNIRELELFTFVHRVWPTSGPIIQVEDIDRGWIEVVFLPPRHYGPAHLCCGHNVVEVWVYTTDGGCCEEVAKVNWETCDLHYEVKEIVDHWRIEPDDDEDDLEGIT